MNKTIAIYHGLDTSLVKEASERVASCGATPLLFNSKYWDARDISKDVERVLLTPGCKHADDIRAAYMTLGISVRDYFPTPPAQPPIEDKPNVGTRRRRSRVSDEEVRCG